MKTSCATEVCSQFVCSSAVAAASVQLHTSRFPISEAAATLNQQFSSSSSSVDFRGRLQPLLPPFVQLKVIGDALLGLTNSTFDWSFARWMCKILELNYPNTLPVGGSLLHLYSTCLFCM